MKIPVVYNSSSSVYSGKDNYTKYKLLMEAYCKGKNVMIFRPATVFGLSPRFRLELLPNHFTYMAVNKGRIVVSGGGNYRAAIDIDDLTSAYLKVIEKGIKPEIYDIGHFNMTKDQFALEIGKVVPCDIITTDKIYDTRDLKVDCSKFENGYDWKPKISFEDSIRKIAIFVKGLEDFNEVLNMPVANFKKICE